MKVSTTGYKRNSKDKKHKQLYIPGDILTMLGVDDYVQATPQYSDGSLGQTTTMAPGVPRISFPGAVGVIEEKLPQAQKGLSWTEYLKKRGITDKDMMALTQEQINQGLEGIEKQEAVNGKYDIRNDIYNNILASLVGDYDRVYPLSGDGSRSIIKNIMSDYHVNDRYKDFGLTQKEAEDLYGKNSIDSDLNQKYIDMYFNARNKYTSQDLKDRGNSYRDVPVKWVDAYPKQKLKGIANTNTEFPGQLRVDAENMFRMPVLYDDQTLGQQDVPLLGADWMRDYYKMTPGTEGYHDRPSRDFHTNPAIYPKPNYTVEGVEPVPSGIPNYGSTTNINGQQYALSVPDQNYITNQYYSIPASAMPGASAANVFVDTPNSAWMQNYKNKMGLYNVTQENLGRLGQYDPDYRIQSTPLTDDDMRVAGYENQYINDPNVGFYQESENEDLAKKPCKDCGTLQGSIASGDASNYYQTYNVQYPKQGILEPPKVTDPNIQKVLFNTDKGDIYKVQDRKTKRLIGYEDFNGNPIDINNPNGTPANEFYDRGINAQPNVNPGKEVKRIATPPGGFKEGGETDHGKVSGRSKTKAGNSNYLLNQTFYEDGFIDNNSRRTLKGFITGAPKPGEPGAPAKLANGGELPKAQYGPPDWRNMLDYKNAAPPAKQNLVGDVRKVARPTAVAESTKVPTQKLPDNYKELQEQKIAQDAYDALPEALKRRDVLTADTRSDAEKFARRAWTAVSQPMETIAAVNRGYDIPSGYMGMHDAYEGYGVGSPMTSVVDMAAGLPAFIGNAAYRQGEQIVDDPLNYAYTMSPLGLLDSETRGQALGNYLDLAAVIPTARMAAGPLVKNAGKLYNNVATGNSMIPYAWRSPAVGLSQEASADMFKGLLNSGKLTPQENALIIEYQSNSRPFTGRSTAGTNILNPEKREALNNIIKKYNLDVNSDAILTRRFNSSRGTLGAEMENGRINFGDRPTSFSAGVGTEGYSGAPDRLVIPNRYVKNMGNNLLANPYGKVSDETLGFLEGSAKDFALNAPSLNEAIIGERELIGTGLDFKQIGKVKNDIGGFDYMVKPRSVKAGTNTSTGTTAEAFSDAAATTATTGKQSVDLSTLPSTFTTGDVNPENLEFRSIRLTDRGPLSKPFFAPFVKDTGMPYHTEYVKDLNNYFSSPQFNKIMDTQYPNVDKELYKKAVFKNLDDPLAYNPNMVSETATGTYYPKGYVDNPNFSQRVKNANNSNTVGSSGGKSYVSSERSVKHEYDHQRTNASELLPDFLKQDDLIANMSDEGVARGRREIAEGAKYRGDNYYSKPTEFDVRVRRVKQDLKENGIVDYFNEPITEEHINQLLAKQAQNETNSADLLQRLWREFQTDKKAIRENTVLSDAEKKKEITRLTDNYIEHDSQLTSKKPKNAVHKNTEQLLRYWNPDFIAKTANLLPAAIPVGIGIGAATQEKKKGGPVNKRNHKDLDNYFAQAWSKSRKTA